MYDNSLVVVGEGVGKMGDDHLGAYHDRDDGGDGDDDDVMMMIVMVMILMAMTTLMLTNMEVGKKVVNKLLVGGRVFVMPNISLVNISMVLIFWLKQAVPDCVVLLALIQNTVVDIGIFLMSLLVLTFSKKKYPN